MFVILDVKDETSANQRPSEYFSIARTFLPFHCVVNMADLEDIT